MRLVGQKPILVKKKLSNLVDSIEQDDYSRRAYFCGQNITLPSCASEKSGNVARPDRYNEGQLCTRT